MFESNQIYVKFSPLGGTTASGGGGCSGEVAPSTVAANATHRAKAVVTALPVRQVNKDNNI